MGPILQTVISRPVIADDSVDISDPSLLQGIFFGAPKLRMNYQGRNRLQHQHTHKRGIAARVPRRAHIYGPKIPGDSAPVPI